MIPQTADHFHWDTAEDCSDIHKGVTESTRRAGGGHAHSGLLIYQGDNWPAKYRGSVLTINLLGGRLNRDVLERSGSGYVGRHAPDLLSIADPWFRGVELISGADGGVYIADWSDIGECHEKDGVHRTSGRIYKVVYGKPATTGAVDVAALSNAELVRLQLHEDDWYVRQSRRVIQERAAKGDEMSVVHESLHELYGRQKSVSRRLRALWALYVAGGLDDAWLIEQLNQPDEHLRVWAVKLLLDRGRPSGAVADALTQLAERESSGLVLLFLSSALQQLPPQQRWPLALQLSSKSQFAEDPVLPLMIWYGIEPALPAGSASAIEMVRSTRIGRLRRLLARRITSDLTGRPDLVNELLKVALATRDIGVTLEVLEGMSTALRGWRRAEAPTSWKSTSKGLAKKSHSRARDLVRELAVIFGDGRALDELRGIALSETADLSSRRNAMRSLVRSQGEDLVPLLRRLLEHQDLAPDALRGFAAFDHPGAAASIVSHYGSLRVQGQLEAVNTLASRPTYARVLLGAVTNGTIPREDVTAFQIRQIYSFGDTEIRVRLRELWPRLRHTPTDKAEKIDGYRLALTPSRLADADLGRGRLLFKRSCSSCHMLFGEGGTVGPELTGTQRQNLHYLLDNIVAPSAKPEARPLPSLHSSLFAPDYEPAIKTGVKAMTTSALELLD